MRQLVNHGLIALVLAAAVSAPAANAQSQPQSASSVVAVADGQLSGSAADGVEIFKGIPFAAPPVGALRWRAPQPAARWNGVRDATRNGPNCIQPSFVGTMVPLVERTSEDCLYLNVWRPQGLRANGKMPVVVWIHGGGFLTGGASSPIFDGSSFARKGVIFVSINYRLGRFGFFAHPALLRQNEDGGLVANYGYLDQIAALRWVQANIGAFGGDPTSVTIFGESAGGGSVHMLMTSPLARNLFKRAIIQSGGGRGLLIGTRLLDKDQPGLPSLETLGTRFAATVGISGDDADALARLRALPADKILGDLTNIPLTEQLDRFGGPVIDGRIVVDAPDVSYQAGGQPVTALIVGATNNDLALTPAPSKDAAFATFGSRSSEARILYDPDGNEDTATITARVASDRTWAEPARYVARLLSAKAVPVYLYRFSYVADSMQSQWTKGAPHASEVPYAMDNVVAKFGTAATPRDRGMAELINTYWANFVKTGNPNGAGLPKWAQYNAGDDPIMNFSASGEAAPGPDPWKARLDLVAATAP